MAKRRKIRWGVVGLMGLFLLIVGTMAWTVYWRRQQVKLDVALLGAIKRNDSRDVRSLLTQGADANARVPEGEEKRPTLLDFCKQLLSTGPRNLAATGTPLMYAAEIGNLTIVKQLVDAGADVNAQDKEGYTPLLCATFNFVGHPGPIITLLAEHGADVHAKAKDGTTAWMYSQANPEIPEALQQAEAKR